MNLGIIGTGNMGSTLIHGVYSVFSDKINIFAYNRTKQKLEILKAQYQELNTCDQMETVVANSKILVLALPYPAIQTFPNSVIDRLEEKKPITIALCGYVPIRFLEKNLPSRVAKAYPNINWAVGAGVMIVNFGTRIIEGDKEDILRFLSALGAVYEVSEDEFRPLANLMSCGPALWIKLMDLFVEANVQKYKIDYKLGLELSQKTIEGTFRLMEGKGYSVERIIKTVAGSGGATEVGLSYFKEFLPKIFANAVEGIDSRDRERIRDLLM